MVLFLFLASAWAIHAILASKSTPPPLPLNPKVEPSSQAAVSLPAATPVESMAPALSQLSTSLNQWNQPVSPKSLPVNESVAKD